MKRYLILTLLFVFMLVGFTAYADETAPVKEYIIGAGDVLEINVWDNAALTKTVAVLPDGKIHYPLIGEITAAGKSVGEFKRELEARIKEFVPDPSLSVMVQQVGSMVIYVIGKVNNPGRFILNSDINMLQALSIAGGLNPFAQKKNIRIFREIAGKAKILYFDYDAVTEKEQLDQNILLKKGDVVVVP